MRLKECRSLTKSYKHKTWSFSWIKSQEDVAFIDKNIREFLKKNYLNISYYLIILPKYLPRES